jgi:IclR family mhp operon transcriptional activator
MRSFPPVQSVQRALRLLSELNKQRVTTVGDLHQRIGLPKPTIVRLLETLIEAGYVSSDRRLGGYQVTSQVAMLSCGFHGSPMVIEAARPWAINLTRELKWPASLAVLSGDAVTVSFSTIPDSPVSPFHATINMRLSLISRGLGRAYLAFCPRTERELLVRMLASSSDPEDHPDDLEEVVRQLVRSVRSRGFAERDPKVEPKSSSTVAVPIMAGKRVLATFGLTYFRSAVRPTAVREQLVRPLQAAARQIEASIEKMHAAEAGAAAAAARPSS